MQLDGGNRFHFGFRYRDTGIEEEWLFRWTGTRRRLVYHRVAEDGGHSAYRFGDGIGQGAVIERATRSNALFLSCAAQFNHEGLRPIFSSIVGGIQHERRIELRGRPVFQPDEPIVAPGKRQQVLTALRSADLGVVDFSIEVVPTSELPAGSDKVFQPEFLQAIGTAPRDRSDVRVVLQHEGGPGGRFSLPHELESRGTHVLLSRLSDVLSVLDGGQLLVVDELDTSLHPLLCKHLLALFCSPDTNPGGAQLVIATHETLLLEALRTDEVVLVDKNVSGESALTPASDYAGVRSRDDLFRAYLQGKLRGLPIISGLARPSRGSLEVAELSASLQGQPA